jgi:hypothetical protein
LIPLWTSRKAASSEGALFNNYLSSSPRTSPGVGTSTYAFMAQEAEEGEITLEEMEMEMQPCHGSHNHRLEHSDDQGMEELDLGWEAYEYKKD